MNLKLVLALPLALYWLGRRRFRNQEQQMQEMQTGHQDTDLDEALEESFPASDPPAMTNPSIASDGVRSRH